MALLPAEPTDCVCDSPQGGDASGSDRTIEPMDSRSTGSSNKSASDPDASGAEDFVMVELVSHSLRFALDKFTLA